VNPRSEPLPDITVVVPTFNEQSRIVDCIEALNDQTYPSDRYRIVVVDNGSTDQTADRVRKMGTRLLVEPQRSPYRARNRAIRSTDSAYVALTDATCRAESNWLEKLHKRASQSGAWVVGGLTLYESVNNSLANRLFSDSHRPEDLRRTVEDYQCVAANNLFVNREAFASCGGFRLVRSGSDIEFSRRVGSAGFGVAFAEQAVVRRKCDLGNWQYLKRTFRIRSGQRTHAGDRHGLIAAMGAISQVPWRPGFRAVAGRGIGTQGWTDWVAEWLYRWANRWAGFLGDLHATLNTPDESLMRPPACRRSLGRGDNKRGDATTHVRRLPSHATHDH